MTDFRRVPGNVRVRNASGSGRVRGVAAVACVALAVSSLAWAGNAVANGGTTTAYFTMAQQAGGTGDAAGLSVAVANDGSRIITGEFQGAAYFPTSADDSINLMSNGNRDVFVAQMNADDSYFTWAVSAGGTGSDGGTGVAVIGDDTPIVTGSFAGTATFPTRNSPVSLTSAGNSDAFVAAMNADDSKFAWVSQISSGPLAGVPIVSVEARSIAVTGDDTPIVTGWFTGTATFPTRGGSVSLTSTRLNGFVAALNVDDSTFAWVSQISNTASSVQPRSMTVTGDDTPIITGSFSGTATFPTRTGTPITLSAGAGAEVFVAALNADDSTFAWALRAGGGSDDYGFGVAVTGDDAPIVTGSFKFTAYFPKSATPDDSIALTAAGSEDIFVAAVKPDGSGFAWAISAGDVSSDEAYSVAVTRDNGVPIVTGYFDGTAYFPKSAADDSIALTSRGGSDSFVAAVKTDGSGFAWATNAGGTGWDFGNGVAVLGNDTPVVTGRFNGTAYFPKSADDDSITLPGFPPRNSIFLAQVGISTALDPDPVPPSPVLFPPSAPLSVAGEAGNAEASITWSAPASSGSFPITTYQAVASPGGQSCLASAPALACTITGLTNGTGYTATVRALNGAGWGPYSAASAEFTPRAPVTPSITITGTRGEVRGKPGIIVTGISTGLEAGTLLQPWLRLPGRGGSQPGLARIEVSSSGEFTWQRRTAKKVTLHVASADGAVRSNRVVIPVAARR